jgi:alpha-tubulin suppressor-like RCC1 family protein
MMNNVDLGGATATDIDAGYSHSCAILATGSLRCWGLNDHGQLGYGYVANVGDDESPALDIQFF